MTNLPPLNWRLGASPARPTTTSATNVIARLKTQIQGLNYWQLVESPNTGTLSLVLKPIGAPTNNSSQFSSASNMNVVIASNVTGSAAYRTPDTNTSNGQFRLQFGLTPNITEGGSGSFRGRNADRPFKTATGNPRWSGYWHCANTGSISASFILESLESIFIGFKDNTSNSGTMGILIGVLAETFDSASGESWRRYGMATTGISSMATNFWASTAFFFGSFNQDGNPHMGVFAVSGGTPVGDAQNGLSANIWEHSYRADVMAPNYDGYATWSGSPAGSRQIAFPVTFFAADVAGGTTAPFNEIGMLRGVFAASDDMGGLIRIQSGGIDQAFKVVSTHHKTSTNNAFIVGPASGSGL